MGTAEGDEEKGKLGPGDRGAGSTRGHELHLASVRDLAGRKGSHSAATDIRDQRHAGDQRKIGEEEADREVTLVPVPAQPTGAAKCTSVGQKQQQRAGFLCSPLAVFLAHLRALPPNKLSRHEGTYTDLVTAWWPDCTPALFLL